MQQLAKKWGKSTDQSPCREANGEGYSPEEQLSFLRFSRVDQFCWFPTRYPLIVSLFIKNHFAAGKLSREGESLTKRGCAGSSSPHIMAAAITGPAKITEDHPHRCCPIRQPVLASSKLGDKGLLNPATRSITRGMTVFLFFICSAPPLPFLPFWESQS